MDKPTVIRRARIAASVFFGVLAIAVLAMWVRSYSWRDVYLGPQLGGRNLLIASTNGHVTIMGKSPPSYLHPGVNTEPPADAFVPPIYFSAHYSGFVLSHWFLALAFAGFAYFLCAKRFYATRLKMGLGV